MSAIQKKNISQSADYLSSDPIHNGALKAYGRIQDIFQRNSGKKAPSKTRNGIDYGYGSPLGLEKKHMLRIEVTAEMIFRLLKTGHICAADLNCLDCESKRCLLKLVLDACRSKSGSMSF